MAGLGTINRYNRDCKFYLILIKKRKEKNQSKIIRLPTLFKGEFLITAYT